MRYHPFVFAPDANGPDGPTIELERSPLPPLGTQTTLPIPEREPVLFDARGEGIFFENPAPRRRPIGFGR